MSVCERGSVFGHVKEREREKKERKKGRKREREKEKERGTGSDLLISGDMMSVLEEEGMTHPNDVPLESDA